MPPRSGRLASTTGFAFRRDRRRRRHRHRQRYGRTISLVAPTVFAVSSTVPHDDDTDATIVSKNHNNHIGCRHNIIITSTSNTSKIVRDRKFSLSSIKSTIIYDICLYRRYLQVVRVLLGKSLQSDDPQLIHYFAERPTRLLFLSTDHHGKLYDRLIIYTFYGIMCYDLLSTAAYGNLEENKYLQGNSWTRV